MIEVINTKGKCRHMRGAILCQLESIKLFAFEWLDPCDLLSLECALRELADDLATAADLEREDEKGGAA